VSIDEEYVRKLKNQIEMMKTRLYQYSRMLESGKQGKYKNIYDTAYKRKEEEFEWILLTIGLFEELTPLQELEELQRLYLEHFAEMTIIYESR